MTTHLGLPRSRWRAFKIVWYEQVRPVWRDIRPVVIATATVAVFVLGTIGFQQYHGPSHDRAPFWLDSFYRTLTLFELDGYDVEPPIPWTLEVARFLAPVIVGYAVFRGVVSVFRNQLQLVGIRLLVRNHVVVAGLGAMGFRLATAFRAEGFGVIVVEVDETNPSIQGCKERGITVLTGDGRDRRMLAKARAGHARYLVVTCGDDGRNVEVEVAASRLAEERRSGVLHAIVHLDDAGLWRMLKSEVIARQRAGGMRLEFFNVYETGARMLLDERPPFAPTAMPRAPRRPHVLVVGLDGIGDSLVLNVARLWQNTEPTPEEALRITILAEDAAAQRSRLLARYPELERIAELRGVDAPLGVELQRGPLGVDVASERPVSVVYISLAQEAQALEVALALRARPEMQAVPFAVAVNDARAGLATVLHDDPETSTGVYGFGVLNRTLQVLPLIRGTNEALARAKHEEYIRHELEHGRPMGEGVMLAWDQLDEEWKDANRAFADGIGAKLEAAGCVLVPAPLIDPNGPLFTFTDKEVEELAKLEHDRWVEDKLRAGWRYGTPRDNERKLHPLLVPWEKLPEAERKKDRDPVRELPQMLAHAGFEILRAGAAAPRADLPALQGELARSA